MKTFKIFCLSFLFIGLSTAVIAQTKTEKIKVSGECGMCKSKIEKAAKSAGASYALWDVDSKELTVKYKSTSTNTAKIEKAVAGVGYDTKNVKASEEAYNKLHECCKYERSSSDDAKADCCKDGKCADCKDGKCTKDMEACKEGKCEHHAEEANAAKGSHSCCKKA
jgi:periplasmic mercuric ion binding protein